MHVFPVLCGRRYTCVHIYTGPTLHVDHAIPHHTDFTLCTRFPPHCTTVDVRLPTRAPTRTLRGRRWLLTLFPHPHIARSSLVDLRTSPHRMVMIVRFRS